MNAIPSKIPTPDEIVILSQPLLKAAVKVAERLNKVHANWAFGGDAGEIIMGVNTRAEYLEILTTKDGCEEICGALAEYLILAPAATEKRLARGADVEGEMLPVYVKSHYAELTVDGVKVEVYGDEQIKVGEWDWGDPLDFTPVYSYVIGTKVPIVPLALKSELALGLGWLDSVTLISDAVLHSQHRP
jgi:hypothetical protein